MKNLLISERVKLLRMVKIVSLLPSSTEILYALGLEEEVVAVSEDSDYPPEANEKPKIRIGKLAIISEDLSSLEIHNIVSKERNKHRGRSIYHLDQEEISKFNPDVIITQDLCNVCAIGYDVVMEAVRMLDGKVKVISLEPKTLKDIFDNIIAVGDIAGVKERAITYVEQLKGRVQKISELTGSLRRYKVAFLEWLEPAMIGGHWVHDIIEIAGGIDVFNNKGHSITVTLKEIFDKDPEVIIASPCGFSLKRTIRELPRLINKIKSLGSCKAIEEGRIYAVDSCFYSRHGPRVIDGLEILAWLLHDHTLRKPPAANGNVASISPSGEITKL